MSLDRLFVSVKIGDNGQYLDGMLIDYFDELETGVDFYKALTPDCSKKFRFVQLDRRMKPKIIELLCPVGFLAILDPMGCQIPDPEKYRVRGGVLPFKDIVPYVGKTEVALRDQVSACAPLNGLLIPETIFKSTLAAKADGIPDRAAIAGGPCSIGAGGAAPNYLTWALFGADVTTLTSSLTATQVASTAETASCTINVDLAGFALTLTSAVNPKGNFGAGYQSTFNLTNVYCINCTCVSTPGGSVIQLSKLNLKYIGSNNICYAMFACNSNTANIINKINDCIFDLDGKISGGLRTNTSGTIMQGYNIIVANGYQGTPFSIGALLVASSASSILENCTFQNMKWGLSNYGNISFTRKNIAAFNNSAYDYCYSSAPFPGVGVAYPGYAKCASSDTTGSEDGLRSLVAANQFQSLTLADGDPFLKLKAGSALLGAGVAPGIAANTYGIRGNVRPHGGLYSIGADEWKVKSGFPYAMFMKGA